MEPAGIAILVLVFIVIFLFFWLIHKDQVLLKYKNMSKISETEYYFIQYMRRAYQDLQMADYYLDKIKEIAKQEKYGPKDEAESQAISD